MSMSGVMGPNALQFATQLEAWADAPALVTEAGDTVGYAELARRADAFAARLGVDVRLLCIAMENQLEPVIAYLGALRAGVPVILSASGPGQANAIESCAPDAVFGRMGGDGVWRLQAKPRPWSAPPHPDLALLLSTSGSTGSAKFVRLSGGNLQANASAIASYLRIGPSDRAVTTLPMFYSFGLSVLNSHLAAGASVVLTEKSLVEPDFRALIERHGVTSIAGVPHSYDLMQRAGLLEDLPKSIRTLTQAGGRMAPETIRAVAERAQAQGVSFYVMYGQTEASPRIAYLPPERLIENIGAIGGPIPGGQLWIEDEDGRRLAAGEEGELIYRGPNVMMGYALTREDLAAPAGPDVLRTGDLGVEEQSGIFRITGRKSRFVKPYGLRVSLDELENRVRAAGVAAFVTGDDEIIVAMARDADETTVRQCFEDLSLPSDLLEFVASSTPPKLAGGKPDYMEILRLGRGRRAAEAERSDTFGELEALFRRLGRRRAFDEDMSFEKLGGDSLSYVQCALAIEKALGRIPPGWEALSLRELRLLAPASRTKVMGMQFVSVECDILVRCLAILLVLFNHGLGHLNGGADVLMMLAGFSWSRFQRRRLADGATWAVLRDYARRYLIVFLIAIAIDCIEKGKLRLDRLTFTGTFVNDWHGILSNYWFIETLTWCVVIVSLAALAPSVRRWMVTRPLALGLGFVAVAAVARYFGAQVFDAPLNWYRSPDQMLIYFAVGWTAALSRGLLRAALLGVLIFAAGSAWGFQDSHVMAMGVAAALMVFVDRIALPAPIGSAVILISAASFYIYLFNPLPLHVTNWVLHATNGRFWAFQILATLAGGLGLYWLVDWFNRRRDGVFGSAAPASVAT
jgi:acyl-CoA synthetase (AMP-forming)/AMP-acid ligase II